MSDRFNDYGLLLNNKIKLHRDWFKQLTKLIGINCVYRPPIYKRYDERGDLDAKYAKGEIVGCIFQEHPDQATLKKMGWVAELQENSSIIHVPYDLHDLQAGALFEIPSGLDTAPSRVFRVVKMQNIMVYPASIACEIAPEYHSVDESHLFNDYTTEDMPLLVDREDDD